MSCTLITSYYPIKSKRPESVYLEWAKTFLTLESPIVLFTPSEYEEQFKVMRGNKPIHIISTPFEDLEMWKQHESSWKHHHTIDHEKNHSPELYAMWAQKSTFVYKTFLLNPFNTDYFFWCDIGAFRAPNIHEEVRKSFPTIKYLPADRIILCSVNSLKSSDMDVQKDGIPGDFTHETRIVGGLWGGSGIGCYNWHMAYNSMLNRYFDKGRFAGKDQNVMCSTYIDNPSLAYVIYPSSDDIKERKIIISDMPEYNRFTDRAYVNPWFFFEYLLTNMGFTYALDPSYILLKN